MAKRKEESSSFLPHQGLYEGGGRVSTSSSTVLALLVDSPFSRGKKLGDFSKLRVGKRVLHFSDSTRVANELYQKRSRASQE